MSYIEVSNISKAYKKYPNLWARLLEWIIPFSRKRHQLIWALENISFKIEPGQAVGIVGINGAGKSTLLKIITGTTQPTFGSVKKNGRVAALLELGMGFHPEFTGRQNVYMAGQLSGLSVKEISKLMPEIEAFSEIGEYIDQPLRVYSSGMEIRLAFSIATAVRPDVLIIDEALSVGDAYFQHKSFSRIKEFKNQGTSILLVSHDKTAIQSLCDKAILLDKGNLIKIDKPSTLMDYYNALILEKERTNIKTKNKQSIVKTIHGTKEVIFKNIVLFNLNDEPIKNAISGEFIYLLLELEIIESIGELNIGFLIKDRYGNDVYGTNTHNYGIELLDIEKNMTISCRIRIKLNLGPGNYALSVAAVESGLMHKKSYEWIDNAYTFNVHNLENPEFIGTSYIPTEFSIEYKHD